MPTVVACGSRRRVRVALKMTVHNSLYSICSSNVFTSGMHHFCSFQNIKWGRKTLSFIFPKTIKQGAFLDPMPFGLWKFFLAHSLSASYAASAHAFASTLLHTQKHTQKMRTLHCASELQQLRSLPCWDMLSSWMLDHEGAKGQSALCFTDRRLP